MPRHRHSVYRLYDRDGQLLYVGTTADWAARRRFHELRDPWFAEVWRTELEPPAPISAAEAHARRLIRAGAPRYQGPSESIACAATTDWLTVREAARARGVSSGRILSWLESGRLTAAETPDGPRIDPAALDALR